MVVAGEAGWRHVSDIGHGLNGDTVFFQAEAVSGKDLLVGAGVEIREAAGK